MARTVIALLLGLLTITISAQSERSGRLPLDSTIKVGKLPNGLTYYLRRNAKPENKIEFRLVVNAGSVLERDDQQGVAHFLEHMAFNGTKGFKKNELISYLQSIGVQFGADLNAYTTFDETVYVLPVPTDKPEYVDTGIQILTEWASAITLDPAEIEHERGVILEELRLGNGADRRMLDRYFPKIFASSKYANRLPIGKKEVLENFNPQAIVDFYEDWYRPDLMAVVAVGNFNLAEMEKKIRANFSSMKPKRGAKLRPEFDVPDHRETIMAVETDKEAPITMVQMLFKKPPAPVNTKSDYRRELVKSVFTGMLGSRLMMHMVSDSPPYVLAGANFAPYVRNKTVYSMFGVTEPKNVRTTLSTFFKEIRRVTELGFDENELQFAKEVELKHVENKYNDREKTESGILANSIVQHFLQKKPMPGADFDHAFSKSAISSITQKEVNDVAKEMLAERNRVIVIVGEEKAGVTYPTESEIASLMKATDTLDLKEDEDAGAKEDSAIAESSAGDSKKEEVSRPAATIANERVDTRYGITYLELSNGAKIALRPDPKADEVVMKAFSPGGLSLIDPSKSLSRDFIAMFDGEGGITSQYEALSKTAITGKSTRVSRMISDSHEYINGSSSSDRVDDLLARVSRQFRENILDSFTFDAQIRILGTFSGKTSVDPQMFFAQEVNRTMTQGSPLAKGMLSAEQLDKLSLADVNAVYKDRFGDVSDFTFILTGNFQIEKIKPSILQHLGSLAGKNRTELWRDHGIRPPEGKVEKLFRKGDAQKSFVRLAFIDEAKYDPADDRILRFLGDLLEIKLLEVLREEKAGVYTVSSNGGMFRRPYERFEFAVEFPCGPENVDSLIEAAVGEIAKLQDGQILENDLNKVKATMVRRSQENAKASDYWAESMLSNLREGTEMVSLDETERRIKGVTRDDIVRIAKKYLKTDKIKQFVLMPDTAPQNRR